MHCSGGDWFANTFQADPRQSGKALELSLIGHAAGSVEYAAAKDGAYTNAVTVRLK